MSKRRVQISGFFLALVALAGVACLAVLAQPKEFYQAASTKRMGERLREIYRAQDFRTDPSKDQERADYYRNGLKQKLDPRTELKARLALGDALLRANKLLRNDGKAAGKEAAGQWRFTDVTAAAGVGEPLHSFAAWFWDYDNDGRLDLLAAGFYTETLNDIGAFEMGLPHHGETPRLYRNNGDGTFSDVTKAMRFDRVILAMGANFGDLDNDGWLDCYFGTGTPEFAALLPNRMFRNAGGKDVTTAGGFGHLQKGHAVSFADLDHDGDEDVFEVIGGAYPGDTYQR